MEIGKQSRELKWNQKYSNFFLSDTYFYGFK